MYKEKISPVLDIYSHEIMSNELEYCIGTLNYAIKVNIKVLCVLNIRIWLSVFLPRYEYKPLWEVEKNTPTSISLARLIYCIKVMWTLLDCLSNIKVQG